MADVNPPLLKLAREARGWTQIELSKRSGVSQGSLSKYEKGLVAPGERQLDSLAEALAFPRSFFEDLESRPAAVLYRSRSLRSARLEAHVRARLNLARIAACRLLDDIAIETVARFPEPDQVYDGAEQAAEFLRTAWSVPPGPIRSVSGLIEAAGGIALRVDLGSDQVVAAFMHPLGDPIRWFFVNTRVTAGDRVRFSLAHELGHAILHEDALVPDTRDAERESNRFAGSFLLPKRELLRDLPRGRLTLDDLFALKRRWGVSMQTIAMCARQAEAISRDDLTRIYREINYRGYRVDEPGEVSMEHPSVFSEAIRIHRHEHGYSDQDLAASAGVTPAVLNDLFPYDFNAPRASLRVVSGAAPSLRGVAG